MDSLSDLSDLSDGWHDPDSFAPQPKLIDLVSQLIPRFDNPPQIFPEPSGDISLYWEMKHITLFLGIDDGLLCYHTREEVITHQFDHQGRVEEILGVVTHFMEQY